MNYFAHLWAAPLIFIVVLLATAVLAFEIWMFVDVIKNKKLRDTEKILWALGMLLLHPFIAIVYYFMAYSGRKK